MRRKRCLPEIGPVGLALVLTTVAGLVDAAAYLALGGVFVANQTGNCVLLAIGIAERLPLDDALPGPNRGVSEPLTSLAAFCVGVAAAGWLDSRILGRVTAIWPLVGAESLLLVAAAVPGPNWARVGLAAAAMGVQSTHGMRLGINGVPTTVVTSTLTRLFAGSSENSHRRRGSRLLALVWLLYMIGAIVGATVTGLWSFTTICLCAAAMTGLGAAARKPRSG
ncbi:YoaK family protein [Actinomadura citrea]|uniref:YoaK family protein n=1 Tax=Actinomadura citrea TaxID=46158 RepID=UPI002E2D9E3F|nr:YoaK family protein [Actinomadura citrea]